MVYSIRLVGFDGKHISADPPIDPAIKPWYLIGNDTCSLFGSQEPAFVLDNMKTLITHVLYDGNIAHGVYYSSVAAATDLMFLHGVIIPLDPTGGSITGEVRVDKSALNEMIRTWSDNEYRDR